MITHGHSRRVKNGDLSPTYKVWLGMKARCRYPSKAAYKYYGAKGITVCDRWEIFDNFLFDMGEKPEGMMIERNDSKKNYCPENCRWATKKEQMNNMKSNRVLLVHGTAMTMTQASERFGVKVGTIWKRLSLGWDESLAATKMVI